jgi:hypothetical protein
MHPKANHHHSHAGVAERIRHITSIARLSATGELAASDTACGLAAFLSETSKAPKHSKPPGRVQDGAAERLESLVRIVDDPRSIIQAVG